MRDISLNYENRYPTAEMYQSLVKESDTAFAKLLKYFEKVEEPTMIVMFGDHWPNLDLGFFNELFGKNFGTLKFFDRQRS